MQTQRSERRPPRVKAVASRYLDSNKENEAKRDSGDAATVVKPRASSEQQPGRLRASPAAVPHTARATPVVTARGASARSALSSLPAAQCAPVDGRLPPTPSDRCVSERSAPRQASANDGLRQRSSAPPTAPSASASTPAASPAPPLRPAWECGAHHTAWLQSLFLAQRARAAHAQRRRAAERQLSAMQRAIRCKAAEAAAHSHAVSRMRRAQADHDGLSQQHALLRRCAPHLRSALDHHDRLTVFVRARTRGLRLAGLEAAPDGKEAEAVVEIAALLQAITALLHDHALPYPSPLAADCTASSSGSSAPVLLTLGPAVSQLSSLTQSDGECLQRLCEALAGQQQSTEASSSAALQCAELTTEAARERMRRAEGHWSWVNGEEPSRGDMRLALTQLEE